jgi:hypothetical protein
MRRNISDLLNHILFLHVRQDALEGHGSAFACIAIKK